MPKWIHDRAKHLQAKNPDMPESQAWAIATQQAHALGKSPKGYGTEQGREEAKAKYPTPGDDEKKAKGAEMNKLSKELTTQGREHIKDKNFALTPRQSDTGKPAYPIHDKAHAANALARVKQFGTPSQKSEVYKDVARKFPELAAKSDVPALQEKAKEAFQKAAGPLIGYLGGAAGADREAPVGGRFSGATAGWVSEALSHSLMKKYPEYAAAIEVGEMPVSFLLGALAGRGYSHARKHIVPEKKAAAEHMEFQHDPTAEQPQPDGEMVLGRFHQMVDLASQLGQMIHPQDQLPPWVVDLITRSHENLKHVHDFIEPKAHAASEAPGDMSVVKGASVRMAAFADELAAIGATDKTAAPRWLKSLRSGAISPKEMGLALGTAKARQVGMTSLPEVLKPGSHTNHFIQAAEAAKSSRTNPQYVRTFLPLPHEPDVHVNAYARKKMNALIGSDPEWNSPAQGGRTFHTPEGPVFDRTGALDQLITERKPYAARTDVDKMFQKTDMVHSGAGGYNLPLQITPAPIPQPKGG